MNSMKSTSVWLVGAGGMALEYHKVLRALDCRATIIGRGEESSRKFEVQSAHPVVSGGLEAFLLSNPSVADAAIVAVGVEALAPTTIRLLQAGVRRILLEKPGALNRTQIEALQAESMARGAQVVIAYNRRFFASTLAAQQMIKEDGGVQSLNFEFTEWGHVIEGLPKARGVKEAWVLANSTHVIDLAFYLGGFPIELNSLTGGSLKWHPTSAIFAGSGRTDQGVLFSYQANWDSPGRWGVEVLTRHRRLILRPMETLQIIRRGSVNIEKVEIENEMDKIYKPGLYRQVASFLFGDSNEKLCLIGEQVRKWGAYSQIAGYENSFKKRKKSQTQKKVEK
jgi:predicted dehydrogenase